MLKNYTLQTFKSNDGKYVTDLNGNEVKLKGSVKTFTRKDVAKNSLGKFVSCFNLNDGRYLIKYEAK